MRPCRYRSLTLAQADGYVLITPSGLRAVHYIKLVEISDGDLLDPQRVQSLVYATCGWLPSRAALWPAPFRVAR